MDLFWRNRTKAERWTDFVAGGISGGLAFVIARSFELVGIEKYLVIGLIAGLGTLVFGQLLRRIVRPAQSP